MALKAEVKSVRHGIDAESFAAILVKDNRRNARSPLGKIGQVPSGFRMATQLACFKVATKVPAQKWL